MTTVSYATGVAGQPDRKTVFRAAYVAKREAGGWKLLSAQYTPIRAKG